MHNSFLNIQLCSHRFLMPWGFYTNHKSRIPRSWSRLRIGGLPAAVVLSDLDSDLRDNLPYTNESDTPNKLIAAPQTAITNMHFKSLWTMRDLLRRSHVVIQEMFDIFYQQNKREYMFGKNLDGRALWLIAQSLDIFVDFSYKYSGTQIKPPNIPKYAWSLKVSLTQIFILWPKFIWNIC